VSRLDVRALALPLIAAASLAAGPPAERPARDARAAPERLASWEWYQEVELPPWDKPPRWADFVLPTAVFDRVRPDLADLRLADGQGQTVPYALRVRWPRDEQRPIDARAFNAATRADRSAELSLDLGERPPEHSELAVTASGTDFRRRLRLEGSSDAKDWHLLLDDFLVDFRARDQLVDIHSFRYPVSTDRYLCVQLFPDRSLEKGQPALRAVVVSRTIQVPGEEVTRDAELGLRQPDRGDGGPGSVWPINLGGRVPCARLSFDVADEELTRPFRLEQADPGQPPLFLVAGEWRRRPGEERRPLEIRLPAEVLATRLRLVVTDFGNPPADRAQGPLRGAGAAGGLPADAAAARHLRLYFGNPAAEAPRYDFAASLPPQPGAAARPGAVGRGHPQPRLHPTPRPWTERFRWLVDLVLVLAGLVLLAILAALAREALRRQGAAPPAPDAGAS
jgi:hypothetical protein